MKRNLLFGAGPEQYGALVGSLFGEEAGRKFQAGCADAAGEGREAAFGGPGPARSAYLEVTRKDCDEDTEAERFEVASCGCRSWFCERCCVGRGLALRARLMLALATFKGLMMWTFTIDPKLFASPAAAYEHVREKRCISNVMRRLRELGHLESGRYICVVEWQKQTEMPHFHVLAEASRIPFETVCDLWNRYRPAAAGPVEGDRPGFGSVRFSAPKFEGPEHAARYACKYLIKFPKHGYPAWVLDSVGEVHRYSTSRGFWKASGESEESVEAPEVVEQPDDAQDDATEDACVAATIRERVAKCGSHCVLLRLVDAVDEATGEVKTRREYVCDLAATIGEVAAEALGSLPVGSTRFGLPERDLKRVIREFGCRAQNGCGVPGAG